jgi:hypothetical protein
MAQRTLRNTGMSGSQSAQRSSPTKAGWFALTPSKILALIVVLQGVLFVSEHYLWFPFNKYKGYTVVITVAATALLLLLLMAWGLTSRLFQRKAQFSLATLLWMVPVVAIPCGWLARELELAHRQKEAVAFYLARYDPLGNFGSSYSPFRPDAEVSPVHTFLASILGDDFFGEITSLVVRSADHTSLEKIGSLPQVRWLRIQGNGSDADPTNIDAGLKHLAKLPHLTYLYIVDVNVTDKGLVHLIGHKGLRTVNITSAGITDQGLAHLSTLSDLNCLDLKGASITDEGLKEVAKLTQLHSLYLRDTPVTDASLKTIAGLSKLESLALSGTRVEGTTLVELKKLSDLEFLDLQDTAVTDAGLRQLEGFTQLGTLYLSEGCVTHRGVKDLKRALYACQIQHSSGRAMHEDIDRAIGGLRSRRP